MRNAWVNGCEASIARNTSSSLEVSNALASNVWLLPIRRHAFLVSNCLPSSSLLHHSP